MIIPLCVLGAALYLAIGLGAAWLLDADANWALAIAFLWMPAIPVVLIGGTYFFVISAIVAGLEWFWKRFANWWTYGRHRKAWRLSVVPKSTKAPKGG